MGSWSVGSLFSGDRGPQVAVLTPPVSLRRSTLLSLHAVESAGRILDTARGRQSIGRFKRPARFQPPAGAPCVCVTIALTLSGPTLPLPFSLPQSPSKQKTPASWLSTPRCSKKDPLPSPTACSIWRIPRGVADQGSMRAVKYLLPWTPDRPSQGRNKIASACCWDDPRESPTFDTLKTRGKKSQPSA
jgi:hypothetical protein